MGLGDVVSDTINEMLRNLSQYNHLIDEQECITELVYHMILAINKLDCHYDKDSIRDKAERYALARSMVEEVINE